MAEGTPRRNRGAADRDKKALDAIKSKMGFSIPLDRNEAVKLLMAIADIVAETGR